MAALVLHITREMLHHGGGIASDVLADTGATAGRDHPDTIAARALADSERHLGPDHPTTQTVRGHLAAAAAT